MNYFDSVLSVSNWTNLHELKPRKHFVAFPAVSVSHIAGDQQ